MVGAFEQSQPEMEIWRKLRIGHTSNNKMTLHKEHLLRCMRDNVIPQWALLLAPWTHDFTQEEQDKLTKLKKKTALRRVEVLQQILASREKVEKEKI